MQEAGESSQVNNDEVRCEEGRRNSVIRRGRYPESNCQLAFPLALGVGIADMATCGRARRCECTRRTVHDTERAYCSSVRGAGGPLRELGVCEECTESVEALSVNKEVRKTDRAECAGVPVG